eukprot:5778669-Pleurochrysis_carterae.AAC.3
MGSCIRVSKERCLRRVNRPCKISSHVEVCPFVTGAEYVFAVARQASKADFFHLDSGTSKASVQSKSGQLYVASCTNMTESTRRARIVLCRPFGHFVQKLRFSVLLSPHFPPLRSSSQSLCQANASEHQPRCAHPEYALSALLTRCSGEGPSDIIIINLENCSH